MEQRTCVVDGCDKPRRYSAGWCPMHYQRIKARGTTDAPPAKAKALCPCGEPVRCKGLCRACYRKDHYSRNKGHENASAQVYYRDNADRRRQATQAWYRANKERASLRAKANRERTNAQRRELMKDPARRERVRRKAAEWRKRSESWRLSNRENQRRRRRVDGKPVDYAAILAEHGMFCHICSMVIVDMSDLHMDHVIPLSLGGPHAAENIRPAHAICNLRKGARIV
jgi:5-methylcytosine-specific restriction endonuclease McrA